MKPLVSKKTLELLKKNQQGIKLDIGCGESKQPGFVGLDILPLPGVDIVTNFEKFPWPLPDECASLAMARHVLEHISPTPHDPRTEGLVNLLLKKKLVKQSEIDEFVGEPAPGAIFLRFMDEVWRILKPGGQFMFVTPYAGSAGYWWDPTHINGISEVTPEYFDPLGPRTYNPQTKRSFWHFYRPKPWKIVNNLWSVNGNMEVLLEKRAFRKDEDYVN